MRRLLISTFVSFVWIIPAVAQDAPKAQPADPNAGPEQSDSSKDATQTIQQLIQDRLASAGFTDIQMVPNSFLISAKDRDGRPVMMMASPHASEDSGQSKDEGADAPSDQPNTTGQGLIEDM
jgi:hypothetical protein